jgi:hypothetical protein
LVSNPRSKLTLLAVELWDWELSNGFTASGINSSLDGTGLGLNRAELAMEPAGPSLTNPGLDSIAGYGGGLDAGFLAWALDGMSMPLSNI